MISFARLAIAITIATTATAIASPAIAAAAPEENKIVNEASINPVIVVFKYNADYGVFGKPARSDARHAEAPQAWQYVDRSVLGAVQALEDTYQFQVKHVFSHALRGFSAWLTPAQVRALQNEPLVERVEPVGTVTLHAQSLPWGVRQIGGHLSSTRSGDGSGTVSGVHVYVIDTGIDTGHRDLSVLGHVNFAGDGQNIDCHGHGTHTAGVVGARDNDTDVVGVAPGVPLIGVKVIGCSGFGFLDDVIKGVDWVTAVALKPSLVNISVGGGAYTPLDEAIQRSVATGLFYAVAAGNSAGNACDHSPARAGFGFFNGVVTVAATDEADREAAFSNSGECVDLWAPGTAIPSTYLGNRVINYSGTSAAVAHVAGAAALLLARTPGLLPGATELALKSASVAPGTTSRDGRPIARVTAFRF